MTGSSDPERYRDAARNVRGILNWLTRLREHSNGGGAAALLEEGLAALGFAAAFLEHHADDLDFRHAAGEPVESVQLHFTDPAGDIAQAYSAGQRMSERIRGLRRMPRGSVYVTDASTPVLVIDADGSHDRDFCECAACEERRRQAVELGPGEMRRALADVFAARPGVQENEDE